ncbi:hypothetical protein FPV67DRAFT_1705148 [Lyophyllum atratum]|nr:hypothetical protein FPV67DRAFT_1705148 [Lyophyllum atratum]
MQCLLSLITLFLPVLSVSALVSLGVGTQAGVFVPTEVKWTREQGDPKIFDLRFINSVGADVGFAQTIRADRGSQSGTVPVIFTSLGQFTLKAVDFEDGDKVIATSQAVFVGPNPPNPTETPTTSVSTVGPPPPTTAPLTTPATTAGSTSTSGLSSTSTSSNSNTPTPTPTLTPSTGTSKPASKTPAIVGGIIGALAFIGLFILLLVFLKRRRENIRTQRRLTFHRDLMVQHRPTHGDIERGGGSLGMNLSRSPILPALGFQQHTTVPTPRGPTKPHFRASSITIPIPEPAPTQRQVMLGDRIQQLEQQMVKLRRQNRGQQGGMGPVLGQMRTQVVWLRGQWDSPWARGETDVAPHELDIHMA